MKIQRVKFPGLKSKRNRLSELDCFRRKADWKSAIRQTGSLRYVAGSSVGCGRLKSPVVGYGRLKKL
jgi:hypothetical protein